MKRNQRRNHSASDKARIALVALMRRETFNQIAAENELHPVQVSQWKKELMEGASSIFERESTVKKRSGDKLQVKSRLEGKIAELTEALDCLSKRMGEVATVKVRKAMVNAEEPISIRRQSELLNVNRNRLKSSAEKFDAEDQRIARLMEKMIRKEPAIGSRKLVATMRQKYGVICSRARITRLRKLSEMKANEPRPLTRIASLS